mgnify:CR=1 FL=1
MTQREYAKKAPFLLSSLKSYMFLRYTRCKCGAITLYRTNGTELTLLARNKKRLLPLLDLRRVPRSPYDFTTDCPRCRGEDALDL